MTRSQVTLGSCSEPSAFKKTDKQPVPKMIPVSRSWQHSAESPGQKVVKLKDGFRVFPSQKHQGQSLLCIARLGTRSPATKPSLALEAVCIKPQNTSDAAQQKVNLRHLKLQLKNLCFERPFSEICRSSQERGFLQLPGYLPGQHHRFRVPTATSKPPSRCHLKCPCLLSMRFVLV